MDSLSDGHIPGVLPALPGRDVVVISCGLLVCVSLEAFLVAMLIVHAA